jgi:hypothetical protein
MEPPSCEPLLPNHSDALPRYRHAAPSGPWPWMDFSHVDVTSASTAVTTVATVATDVATDESDARTTVTDTSTATQPDWSEYPQKPFENWTPTQVQHSQMLAKCSENGPSKIYWMDVGDDGKFTNRHPSTVTAPYYEFWDILQRKVNLACHLCPRLGG